jgi:hypothetical protein
MAVAAAAALALVWGMHRPDYTSVAVPIAQEPVSPRVVAPSAPAAAPEDPPSVEPPRAPLAPVPRTVVSPSASASASPAASAESSSTAPAENESTLGEENRLFKAAAEASRSGNVPSAIQFLDQLLTQYPRSPLAQTALVRKFRLLADAGRLAEAVREAERYLSLYPMGFAVSEAQALKSRHEPIPAASDAEQDRPAPANEEAARP